MRLSTASARGGTRDNMTMRTCTTCILGSSPLIGSVITSTSDTSRICWAPIRMTVGTSCARAQTSRPVIMGRHLIYVQSNAICSTRVPHVIAFTRPYDKSIP